MKCPTCSRAFVRLPFLGRELDACPRGEWVWIARGRLAPFSKAIQRRPSRRDLASLEKECAAREKAVARALKRGTAPHQRCPECEERMAHQPLSRVGGILAHCCINHGFLVARKGFETFVDFLARGGETLARQRLTKRVAQIAREAKAAQEREAAGDLFSLLMSR
ncbi:MAG: hypothetical protein L0323_22205 [Planctomycetes bacterium]|nr:hypothetical protein [Planctomycetota bacterium]